MTTRSRSSKDPPAPRAWQRMLSGRRLDLLNPSPLDIEIEDIAHGLARVARWNGQTKGDHAFSVAQHSVLVESLVQQMWPGAASSHLLGALLHDAPEYVIGDMISPFKNALGVDYRQFEARLESAIRLRFGLTARISADLKARIKQADQSAAFYEATRLAGFGLSILARAPLSVTLPPGRSKTDPLAAPLGDDRALCLSTGVGRVCQKHACFRQTSIERLEQHPEAGNILAVNFKNGMVEPLPAEVDARTALPHVVMARACVKGLLEHRDPGLMPETAAEDDRGIGSQGHHCCGQGLGQIIHRGKIGGVDLKMDLEARIDGLDQRGIVFDQ